MSESHGHTAQIENLLARLHAGDSDARERLIEHACERLRVLTSRMLQRFPNVHRWEETDDIFAEAATRLYRSLIRVRPESARHFYNLAASQIRRVLIDVARKHFGPEGIGANHDSVDVAADTAQPRAVAAVADSTEPGDLLE